jgi:preflagellin peptidase FlaK
MVTTYILTAIAVSIIGLLTATYTDLRERIVPNKLNYALAIIGLAIFAVESYIEANPIPFAMSILGLALGFSFGWVMWKLGVFAGGDVKLFMGLGALNPLTASLIASPTSPWPIFPITLFIYSLISFLPYGLFMVVTRVVKNKIFQKELFEEMKPKVLSAIHASIFASSTYALLELFKITPWATLIALIIWGFFGKNKKYLTIITLISACILNITIFLQAMTAALIFSVGAYTIIKLMLSTRKVLSSEVAVKDLTEGMIPAVSLVREGKKIIQEKGFSMEIVLKCIREKNSAPLIELLKPKKEIISARKARGLTDEELIEVKKLAAKGLIPKKIMVKESMPFVPTMLLGYILCLVLGDLVLLAIMGLI